MGKKSRRMAVKYFAAANTYKGFVSFFDKVFIPSDFDRIYVLKGGPGTGKSSFMKRLSTIYQKDGCYVEEIYCSSDPKSLDGLIIEKGGKKIAVLDGTAPHETDARIPGAVDEIINLGDGWDTRILSAQRDKIIDIANEKSKSYKTAYHYLKAAGVAQYFIEEIHVNNFDIFKAKTTAESILGNFLNKNDGRISTRLVSSFGKYGKYQLDTLTTDDTEVIYIAGGEIAYQLLLDICHEIMKEKGVDFYSLPCALDPRHTDAIYFPEQKFAITHGNGEINANEMISLSSTDKERIRTAERIRDEELNEAQRWFAIASDFHFRLEEIYGIAMNFEKNDLLLDKKILEIDNILEIKR